MSIAANKISLNTIYSSTIEEVVLSTQDNASFPISCEVNNGHFTIASECEIEKNLSNEEVTIETKNQNSIELIIFSTLTFKQLEEVIKQTKVSITHLNAINDRNNQISYRFSATSTDLNEAKRQLATYALEQGFEAALINNAPKLAQPGVLVMDMDSTTIEIECIDEIAALAGVGKEVAEVTELAMQGELDFAQSLHQRVSKLANAPESILADVARDIPLMNGLETLIKILQQHNWKIAIASGGFTYFADHLKALLNLDAAHANTLEIIDNKLTGKVLGDVVDAQAKADCLLALQKEYSLPHQQTVAMGDGANDLVMMDAAHFGVAFHAKPIVLKQADSAINQAGLDCLVHWLA